MRFVLVILLMFSLAACDQRSASVPAQADSTPKTLREKYLSAKSGHRFNSAPIVIADSEQLRLSLLIENNDASSDNGTQRLGTIQSTDNNGKTVTTAFAINVFVEYIDTFILDKATEIGFQFTSLGQSEYFIYDLSRNQVRKLFFDIETSSDGGECDWNNEIIASTDNGTDKGLGSADVVNLYLFSTTGQKKVLVHTATGVGIEYRLLENNILEYATPSFAEAATVKTYDYGGLLMH